MLYGDDHETYAVCYSPRDEWMPFTVHYTNGDDVRVLFLHDLRSAMQFIDQTIAANTTRD